MVLTAVFTIMYFKWSKIKNVYKRLNLENKKSFISIKLSNDEDSLRKVRYFFKIIVNQCQIVQIALQSNQRIRKKMYN